jgi:hypothetical protein
MQAPARSAFWNLWLAKPMSAQMFAIETFTAQADFAEDRIRLDAIDLAGETQSIFLTRRLADRFVPLLITQLEGQVQTGLPKDLGLAMSQQQLRMEREESPIADVEPQQNASRWLCQTIHLGEDQGMAVWTLTDDEVNSAVMALPPEGLRAVLEVILLTYRKLEWALAVFPDWLLDQGTVAGDMPRVLN